MASKATVVLALFLVGCGGGSGPSLPVDAFPTSPGNPWIPNISKPVQGPVLLSPGEPEAMSFEETVGHPYFPLEPGILRVYEGDDGGRFRRDHVRTLADKRVLEGTACTPVQQEVYLDGILSERTTEWYAQDSQGNVWKFGEESYELDEGEWVRSDDSWLAGENGARPWLVLAAIPEVGDRYVGNAADGQDAIVVIAIDAAIDVPAGAFADCLQLHENPDDPEDSDIILVGPGAGLVSEESGDGTIVLTSVVDERTSR
ncbi:MAG: hypothetical protein ACYTHK_02135 [Planctomycetota bacterium]